MEFLLTLVKGMAIGFAMAMPVGPVALLCIRRTLNHGLQAGLLSGLGAALADALLAGVAGTGLASLTDVLLGVQSELRLAGGVFLVLLGIWTFRRHERLQGSAGHAHGVIATSFLLTLTNPMTLLAFLGFFVTFGVTEFDALLLGLIALTAGVFVGSGLWWSLLSAGIGELRRRIDDGLIDWINRASAVAISGFGLFVLANTLL